MEHAGVVALIVLAGCRIGFDPIESGPDAGRESSASNTAPPDTTFAHACEPGTDCVVDCRLAATCVVECNGAASCEVSCAPTDCVVTDCLPGTCNVTCGEDGAPFHYGTTSTCS